jgi:hypothetical protein
VEDDDFPYIKTDQEEDEAENFLEYEEKYMAVMGRIGKKMQSSGRQNHARRLDHRRRMRNGRGMMVI